MARISWTIFLTSLIFANGTFSITENNKDIDAFNDLTWELYRKEYAEQITKDKKESEKQKEEKEEEAKEDEWTYINTDINKKEKCLQLQKEIKVNCGIDANNVARNKNALPLREMLFAVEVAPIMDAINIAAEPGINTTQSSTESFIEINEKDNNRLNKFFIYSIPQNRTEQCTRTMSFASIFFIMLFGSLSIIASSYMHNITSKSYDMLTFTNPFPLPRIFNRRIIMNGDETDWDANFRL